MCLCVWLLIQNTSLDCVFQCVGTVRIAIDREYQLGLCVFNASVRLAIDTEYQLGLCVFMCRCIYLQLWNTNLDCFFFLVLRCLQLQIWNTSLDCVFLCVGAYIYRHGIPAWTVCQCRCIYWLQIWNTIFDYVFYVSVLIAIDLEYQLGLSWLCTRTTMPVLKL